VLLTAALGFTAFTAKADQLSGSPQAGLAAGFLSLFSPTASVGLPADDDGKAIGAPAGGPGCVAPPATLTSWYPGQNNANDIFGDPPKDGSFPGTYAGAQVGNGFFFDGTGGTFVNVPDHPDFDTPDLSVDAWVNSADDASEFHGVVTKYGATNPEISYGLYLRDTGNPAAKALSGWVFQTGGAAPLTVDSAAVVTNGVFNHVAMTFDSTTGVLTLYHNGAVVATTTGTAGAGVQATTTPVRIGGDAISAADAMNGIVDEVGIYSNALTQPEIAAIFAAGSAGRCHDSTIEFDVATDTVGEAAGSITVTARRTGANDVAATVNFAAASGTATGGNSPCTGVATQDFLFPNVSTLTFAPGEREQTVTITICQDPTDENDENFTVTISNPTGPNVSLGTNTTETITITDDDASPSVTVDGDATEEGTNLQFDVTVTGGTALGPVIVCYTTSDGTATAPADYTATSATPPNCLSFAAPGTQTVNVPTVNDNLIEGDEGMFFRVTIGAGSAPATITGNGNPGDPGLVRGRILDNDTSFRFEQASYSIAEGNSGTTILNINVIRDASPSGDYTTATVDVSSIGGFGDATPAGPGQSCSTPGVDYLPIPGETLTFAPGDYSETFEFTICGETKYELDQIAGLQLSNPVNGSEGTPNETTITILNDDAEPTVTFNPSTQVDQNEGNGGGTHAVQLHGESDRLDGSSVLGHLDRDPDHGRSQ
jgi:hypothetical protein